MDPQIAQREEAPALVVAMLFVADQTVLPCLLFHSRADTLLSEICLKGRQVEKFLVDRGFETVAGVANDNIIKAWSPFSNGCSAVRAPAQVIPVNVQFTSIFAINQR